MLRLYQEIRKRNGFSFPINNEVIDEIIAIYGKLSMKILNQGVEKLIDQEFA